MADLLDDEDKKEAGGPLAFQAPDPSRGGTFDARKPETWPRPDGLTWGDHIYKPGKPLSARHRRLALLVWEGKTNKEISERMNIDSQTIAKLKSYKEFKDEIEKLNNMAYQATIQERLKDMGPLAMDTIEEILKSDDNSIKPMLKADLAKWVAEKLDGKAKQSVDHQSSTLTDFMEALKGLQAQRALPGAARPEPKSLADTLDNAGEVIDVTPAPEGKFVNWIDSNLDK